MTHHDRAHRSQRRGRSEPLRNDRRTSATSPTSRSSASGRRTAGSSARTAARRSRRSRVPAASTTHIQTYAYDADHPERARGQGPGPDAASSSCCTRSAPASWPASRTSPPRAGVTLTSVEATIEGDIDLRGLLGISDEVRNGYQQLRVSFRIDGDAPAETLREIVEQSRARSAVYDVLTNGVDVTIDVAVTHHPSGPAGPPTRPARSPKVITCASTRLSSEAGKPAWR